LTAESGCGLLRSVLADLQAEARAVFGGSGETGDGFLQERRKEAKAEGDIPA
jgi:hypothetical protein